MFPQVKRRSKLGGRATGVAPAGRSRSIQRQSGAEDENQTLRDMLRDQLRVAFYATSRNSRETPGERRTRSRMANRKQLRQTVWPEHARPLPDQFKAISRRSQLVVQGTHRPPDEIHRV
jgi:hypothetical protein